MQWGESISEGRVFGKITEGRDSRIFILIFYLPVIVVIPYSTDPGFDY